MEHLGRRRGHPVLVHTFLEELKLFQLVAVSSNDVTPGADDSDAKAPMMALPLPPLLVEWVVIVRVLFVAAQLLETVVRPVYVQYKTS